MVATTHTKQSTQPRESKGGYRSEHISDPAADDCGCSDVPAFRRLRYFYGQALSAADLQREQAYGLDKARLRNKLLHGWGIVCGLDVKLTTTTECDPGGGEQATEAVAATKADTAAKAGTAVEESAVDPGQGPEEPREQAKGQREVSRLTVCSGAAIDCEGNEIVVRQPSTFSVDDRLSMADRRRLTESPATVYITLCYHEELVQPTRPLVSASCDPVGACEYGGVLECYRICVTTEKPNPGPRCEPCCGACGDLCLELAAITDYEPTKPIEASQLDFSGRRSLAVHQLTTITGINWFHGATYARDNATALLDDGLEVVFSHPVDAKSLRPGVVEVLVAEGGDGRAGNVYSVSGEFVDVPPSGLVNSFVYRSNSGERLQYGDHVKITVRGDFIVDECCRAVDANNLGGAVPQLPFVQIEPASLADRPDCPPRPSGDGVEGGDFVSWVFVEERGEDQ